MEIAEDEPNNAPPLNAGCTEECETFSIGFKPYHGFSNLFLMVGALIGYADVRGLIGKVGCMILFLKAVLGCIVHYKQCPNYIKGLYREFKVLASALVIPFICAEICYEGGLQLELVSLHLIYPLLQVFFDFFLDWPLEMELLDLSLTLSVLVMATFTLSRQNYHGVVLGCLYQTSLIFSKRFQTNIAENIVATTLFYLGYIVNGFHKDI